MFRNPELRGFFSHATFRTFVDFAFLTVTIFFLNSHFWLVGPLSAMSGEAEFARI